MNKLILDLFFGTKNFIKAIELLQLFTKEIFTIKDTGATYTTIKNWDKEGILSSHRESESQWRNFNFIDYIWLRVIHDMRSIGIPIKLIKAVKNELFKPLPLDGVYKVFKKHIPEIKKAMAFNEEQSNELIEIILAGEKNTTEEGLTYFYAFIVQCVMLKIPASLIIYKDGSYLVWYEGKSELYEKEEIERKIAESHISISLSNLIKEFLMNERSVFLLPELKLLPPNEIKLMELIHSGEYDSISISFKNKKMKSLELKKMQDTKKKVVDILNEGAYQDIVIKSHKGMVTQIQNTIKVMLNE